MHRLYIISVNVKVENYSIFRRFYPKKKKQKIKIKYTTELLFTRVWRRYSGDTDSNRGWIYFQFCKKARKSATAGIECPFLFSLYRPSSVQDQIVLTARGIGRCSFVFGSNVQTASRLNFFSNLTAIHYVRT